MLSEKYLAGFIDADGSFGIRFRRSTEGRYRADFYLECTQKASRNKVLHMLCESFGCGQVTDKRSKTGYGGDPWSVWSVPPKQARLLIARIEKYLVVKKAFAGICLKYWQDNRHINDNQLELHQKQIRAARKAKSQLPNYPSRKWLAGYFDGDGCFAVVKRKTGQAYFSARITAHIDADNGINLIYKAFGGAIYTNKGPTLPMLVINLPPSKAKQFVEFFGKHLIVKRAEAYFVLGCARGGNYRDGEPIRQNMKQLKARQQRLNDTDVDVKPLLDQVSFNITDSRGLHMRKRQSGAR